MASLLVRRTLYHVAKQRAPAGSTMAMLSTLAASTAPPNLVLSSKPNLVSGGTTKSQSQRRPVAYGAAAALEYDEEVFLPGNLDKRRPNNNGYGHYPPLNGHANGHSKTNGAVVETEPAREYESDLIVVLDMDECLIHSQFMSQNNVAAQWAYQVARRNASSEEGSLFGSAAGQHHPLGRVDSFKISLPDGDLVHVNKRPFLEEFLQQVTAKYETHVFTAAMEVYAAPVLDTLDPHGTRFAKRWYRESCTFSDRVGAYVKDLAKLALPKSHRTVLVDNNPLSFLANPENGILVSNFYDDPTDDSLKAVLDLLHELNDLDDVRPELEKRFGLKQALQELTSKDNKKSETAKQ